jgi:hypothetical protein
VSFPGLAYTSIQQFVGVFRREGIMVVRTWRGAVRAADADACLEYLQQGGSDTAVGRVG